MNRKEELVKELVKLKNKYPEYKLFIDTAINMIKK